MEIQIQQESQHFSQKWCQRKMPPTWKTLYKTVAIGTKIIAIDKRD